MEEKGARVMGGRTDLRAERFRRGGGGGEKCAPSVVRRLWASFPLTSNFHFKIYIFGDL